MNPSPPASRLHRFLAPAVLWGPACWGLDHALTDLLQRQIHLVAPWVTAIATMVGGVAALQLFWNWLTRKLPRPWFPRPAWRAGRWLRQRPALSIITAAAQVNMAGDTVDACGFTLTINRSVMSAVGSVTIDFQRANLVMIQTRAGRTHRTLFRPKDTGGFLALPVRGGGYDAVAVVFEAVAFPKAAPDAPDFNGDYHLKLSGVIGTLLDPKPIHGELAPADFTWFSIFKAGGLGPGVVPDQVLPGAPIQWPSV